MWGWLDREGSGPLDVGSEGYPVVAAEYIWKTCEIEKREKRGQRRES